MNSLVFHVLSVSVWDQEEKGWGGGAGKCQLSPDISGESQQQTLIIH
jgi:hypothetical protein